MFPLLRKSILPLLAASSMAMPGWAIAADADPAMWVAKDSDTTIYLMGTFHALDKDTDWFNDEIKTAFDAADEVVIEAILPEEAAEMQPIILRHALDTSGKPLSEKLSAEARETLHAKLAQLGLPAQSFDKFKPFFASMALISASAPQLGIDPEIGADKQVQKAAVSANKKLTPLETAEFQIGMFNGLSEQEQLAILEKTLTEFEQMPELFDRMLDMWSKGDEVGFRELLEQSSAESPAIHKIVYADRNAKWAKWIDQRLDQPGTVFMAVGTGHLAGPDRVQQYLKQRGIQVERVPHAELK